MKWKYRQLVFIGIDHGEKKLRLNAKHDLPIYDSSATAVKKIPQLKFYNVNVVEYWLVFNNMWHQYPLAIYAFLKVQPEWEKWITLQIHTGWEYGPAPTRVYATTRMLYVALVVKLFNITDIVVAFSVICARTLLELPAFTWNSTATGHEKKKYTNEHIK